MLFNFKQIISTFAVTAIGFTPLSANAASGCTLASHYGVGDGYHGQTTANGERYNAYGLSTAHRSLPFGTRLRVTNQANGRSVVVRVNDRGPFVGGRSLDLSYGAFTSIASSGQGVASVCYSRV
jgi:rare lipoprotein A